MDYSKVKLIAFDFDGVIVDSLLHNMQITNNACRQFGAKQDVSNSILQDVDEMSFDSVAEYIGVPRDNFQPCLELINRQLVETYDELLPFPGIEEAIRSLAAKGKKLIIVTHNTEFAVNAFLEKCGLISCFDLVLGAETQGEKAAKLSNGLKELGFEPQEAVMVGDSVGDIKSAISASVIPLGVAWGYQTSEKITDAGAIEILQTPSEIEKFAKNIKD